MGFLRKSEEYSHLNCVLVNPVLLSLSLSLQVYVSKEGTVAEYGMLAKENIKQGEVLFTIPRSALLHQGTTKVSTLLEQGEEMHC